MWVLHGALGTGIPPTTVYTLDVTDSAVANDYVYTATQADILEAAVGDDAVTITSVSYYAVLDTARGADYTYETVTETLDVSDTAVGNDYVHTDYSVVDVLEAAVGNDYVTLTGTGLFDVLDSAVGNDYVYIADQVDLADSAVGDDSVYLAFSYTLDVLDTAEANDYTYELADNEVDVLDTAEGNDYVYASTSSIVDILDRAYITDYAYPIVTSEAIIWTANVNNWAMSKYTGVEFTSLAGDYAASQDGLFVRGSDYADMEVTFGRSDIGTLRQKGLPYAYIFGAHTKPLSLKVTGDVDGVEGTYSYTQQARKAAQPRAVRCDFGKGFNSTYFKIKIESDGFASLHYVQPVADDLGRTY